MAKKGYFIVIDGADGSGKKTQSEKLLERLVLEKFPTASFDFPQYDKTFFGKEVRAYLKGAYGKATEIHPHLASVLFAADRWQAKPEIEAALEAGKVVIANRYAQSNLAIQRAKLTDPDEREAYLAWEEQMEYDIFKIPQADLVIYLAVPPEVGIRLIEERAKEQKAAVDGHEQIDFLRAMDTSYRELAGRYNWLLIDCTKDGEMRSREDIANEIWEKLASKLPK